MDEIIDEPRAGAILLLIAPAQIAAPILLQVITRLALRGAVNVLDGGNRFAAYRIARAVRGQSQDLHAVLRRIRVARAFTCYQMAALLEGMPAAGPPTIILDLLSLFYDENVRLPEASRLLGESLWHLRRLSVQAPVAISVQAPPPAQAERLALIAQLQNGLDDLCYSLVFEQPPPRPPLRLF